MAETRSALFVIDIQNDLATDEATRIPHAARIRSAGDEILSVARKIIDSYRVRQEKSPSIIVFVQHEETPESGPLVCGSTPWELVFNPRPDVPEEILVAKTVRNTFESNPDLADKLKAEGITSISAFGIQSECCVQETCRGALAAGFDVTLLQGAHSTYDIGAKSAVDVEKEVESLLQSGGAIVTPWEDAVAAWEKQQRI